MSSMTFARRVAAAVRPTGLAIPSEASNAFPAARSLTAMRRTCLLGPSDSRVIVDAAQYEFCGDTLR